MAMKMFRCRVACLALLAITSAGCSNALPLPSPTASPTRLPESQTPLVASTNYPSSTPTIQPYLFLLPTKSTTGIYEYELPDWVKNPDNNLALFTYKSKSRAQVGFLNPMDGAQVIVNLPQKADNYFWKDSTHIVFLQGSCGDSPEKITELDLSQNSLQPVATNEFPESILDCYPSINSDKVILEIDESLAEPTLVTLNRAEQWLKVTNPNDGISDISFTISPNKDYAAVVQIKGKFQFPDLWPQPLFGTQVSIYHLPDKRLITTFSENEKIYSSLLFNNENDLMYVSGNTPCVINVSTLSKECFNSIPQKFPEATIILDEPSTDPTKFSFIYFFPIQDQGGLCFYDLATGGTNCPTDQLEILKGKIVTNYAVSPDNKYILIEYDYKGCPPPWCDHGGDPQLGLIDIQENRLFQLGSSIEYQALANFQVNLPWRPLP